jgi:hypothetical protein
MIILVVEEEGDEGRAECVALADKADFHLNFLVAFD